ncbi:MAG: sulfotransferase domain-containing protein, partial [Phycisphaerales bacterium]
MSASTTTTPGGASGGPALATAPSALQGWIMAHRGMVRRGPLSLVTQSRAADGMLMTMWGSGSHYTVWLLSMAMSEGFGVPRPKSLNDTLLVGRRKRLPMEHGCPQVIWSHQEAPVWLFRIARRLARFPRYVVLVRDLRASFVSYYEKTPRDARYATFSQFLRGNDRYASDHNFFRQIRFLNAWAKMRRLAPDRVTVLRYEDLRARPGAELRRIWSYYGFPKVDDAVFDRAVELSTKEAMEKLATGKDEASVVRKDKRHPFLWYDDADREYFNAAVGRYLRDDYGYDYS